jgi:hypothetical protein
VTKPFWTVAAASVRGRGHEQTGAPCQDSCEVIVSPNGRWVALAASDGAGTAKRSEIGANFVAREFAKCLIRLSDECDRRAPGAWVSDRVIQDIVTIRSRLREEAGSDDISDFHCTLTAALIGPTGGVTVHLGDGAIFGGAADSRVGDVIDLAQDFFVSSPQNGEYANETVFLTESDWVKHLRIHPVAAVDWVMLGTDGGMSLAMVGESRPKSGFVVPVIRALIQESDFPSRCGALERILDDRQADRLTNDDKTLIAAIRAQYREVTGEFGPSTTQGSAAARTAPPVIPPVATHPAPPAMRQRAPGSAASPSSRSEPGRRSRTHRRSRGMAWVLWISTCLLLMAMAVVVWLIFMSPAKRQVLPPVVTTPTPRPAEKVLESEPDMLVAPTVGLSPASPASVSEPSVVAKPATPATPTPVAPPATANSPRETQRPKGEK